MEFVAIHDLSRELNFPARVIRYRLIQPIAERKLKQHEDFRRDKFKDNQYFDWKKPAVGDTNRNYLWCFPGSLDDR